MAPLPLEDPKFATRGDFSWECLSVFMKVVGRPVWNRVSSTVYFNWYYHFPVRLDPQSRGLRIKLQEGLKSGKKKPVGSNGVISHTQKGVFTVSRWLVNLFPIFVNVHKKYLCGEPTGTPDRPHLSSPLIHHLYVTYLCDWALLDVVDDAVRPLRLSESTSPETSLRHLSNTIGL